MLPSMFNQLVNRQGREAASKASLILLRALFLLLARDASAQALDVKITVVPGTPARVRGEGRRAEAATAWSIRNFSGSAAGLAERVENFALFDDSGTVVIEQCE